MWLRRRPEPYFGLRDYGHVGQVGLENSPQEYVAALVAVFAECRRVLVDEGSIWINLGDSYAMSTRGAGGDGLSRSYGGSVISDRKWAVPDNCKPKDLIGIPWSVAFALRADGWYLRSEIIWHKKSCMPESVKDRPTKAHEQVFLLTKQHRYFYDADAIREPYVREWDENNCGPNNWANTGKGADVKGYKPGGLAKTLPRYTAQADDGQTLLTDDMERFPRPETYDGEGQKDYASAGVQNPSAVKARIVSQAAKKRQATPRHDGERWNENDGRGFLTTVGANARSVWSLGPEPATDIEHFAVMPKTLARRCILAGCPFGGTVLDPFAGSGTTGIVALEEGRSFVGIELNPQYHELARKRLANTAPLLAEERST